MIDIEKLKKLYTPTHEEYDKLLHKLKDELFNGRQQQKQSFVRLVVSQPGAGKSTYISQTDYSDYVIINSDHYRGLFSFSNEIQKNYPYLFVALTNKYSHMLGDDLFAYAIQNNYNVLREKAPKDDSIFDSLSGAAVVTIDIIVAGNITSALATRERYEKEINCGECAKLSNLEFHNQIYDYLPNFLGKCEKLGYKINLIIRKDDKKFKVVKSQNLLSDLERFRKLDNLNTLKTFEERICILKQQLTNRNASKAEFEDLNYIESCAKRFYI